MVVLHFRGFISINNAQWDYTSYMSGIQYTCAVHTQQLYHSACRTLVYSSYIYHSACMTLVYSSYIYHSACRSSITVHMTVSINQPRVSMAIFTCSHTVRTLHLHAQGHQGCLVMPFYGMQMEIVVMVYFEANVVYFPGSFINDIQITLHSFMGYMLHGHILACIGALPVGSQVNFLYIDLQLY